MTDNNIKKNIRKVSGIVGKLLKGELGEPIRTPANAKDCGAVFRNLEQLRKKTLETMASEASYSDVVKRLNLGIYQSTIGAEESRFLKVNPAMAVIFGYSEKELLAIPVIDIYQHPEDRADLIAEIQKSGFVRRRELNLKKKDGTPIICVISTTAHYDNKKEIAWMDGVLEDITGQKVAEKELQDKISETEKLNKLMVGRELKMIELKKEIQQLKTRKVPANTENSSRFLEGIELEEDVVQALDGSYKRIVRESSLSEDTKMKILEQLEILLEDSKKHEQMLKDLT